MQWVCDFNTCPARLHTVSIKGTELPRHGATKSSVSSSMRAACSKLYAPARGCKPPCIFFFCSSFASISLLSGHALFRSYSWFVDLSLRQGCSTSKLSPFFFAVIPAVLLALAWACASPLFAAATDRRSRPRTCRTSSCWRWECCWLRCSERRGATKRRSRCARSLPPSSPMAHSLHLPGIRS